MGEVLHSNCHTLTPNMECIQMRVSACWWKEHGSCALGFPTVLQSAYTGIQTLSRSSYGPSLVHVQTLCPKACEWEPEEVCMQAFGSRTTDWGCGRKELHPSLTWCCGSSLYLALNSQRGRERKQALAFPISKVLWHLNVLVFCFLPFFFVNVLL